jgi:hypothetical protein
MRMIMVLTMVAMVLTLVVIVSTMIEGARR